MASNEIKPALTPEEWAAFPDWPSARPTGGEPLPLYYPTRHGIAAVNLHGQPFGFTPRDVRELRALAQYLTEIDPTDQDSEGADFLRAIAAKIAALVSPDDSPTQG